MIFMDIFIAVVATVFPVQTYTYTYTVHGSNDANEDDDENHDENVHLFPLSFIT